MLIDKILLEYVCDSRGKLCQNDHMRQFKFQVKSLKQKGNIFEVDHIWDVASDPQL